MLNVWFTNVDTFNNDKINEITDRIQVSETKPSIIALSEVKPKNYKYERQLSEYNVEPYEFIYQNIGKTDEGRGMIMYIKEGIKYTPVSIKSDFKEFQAIDLNIKGPKKLLALNVYRSPSSNMENSKQ